MKILKRFLTPKEEAAFFAAIKSRSGFTAQRDLHLLRLIRCSGGRVGAVCQLTVGDARRALVSNELSFRDEISKGSRGYDVPLTNAIRDELKALIKLRRDAGLSQEPDQPLVISRTRSKGGEGMTPRGVQMRCAYWSAIAGLSFTASPHWLRHTLGNRLVNRSTAKEPLTHTATVLGHRDIKTTMIYTRPTRDEVRTSLSEAGL